MIRLVIIVSGARLESDIESDWGGVADIKSTHSEYLLILMSISMSVVLFLVWASRPRGRCLADPPSPRDISSRCADGLSLAGHQQCIAILVLKTSELILKPIHSYSNCNCQNGLIAII